MRKNNGSTIVYIDDLVQDCSNSIANALELLQSCTKPSICDQVKSYRLIRTVKS